MDTASSHKRTAFYVLGAACFMLGMSFAAVPLYDLFCRVTGFGGTPIAREALPENLKPVGRVVNVRFDANVTGGLPWTFKARDTVWKTTVGAPETVFYDARNISARETVGIASFNVVPERAAQYFIKMQCFCFTNQTLKAGENLEMPVVYYLDPAFAEDEQLKSVDTVTLSYTFFPAKE